MEMRFDNLALGTLGAIANRVIAITAGRVIRRYWSDCPNKILGEI